VYHIVGYCGNLLSQKFWAEKSSCFFTEHKDFFKVFFKTFFMLLYPRICPKTAFTIFLHHLLTLFPTFSHKIVDFSPKSLVNIYVLMWVQKGTHGTPHVHFRVHIYTWVFYTLLWLNILDILWGCIVFIFEILVSIFS